MVKRKVMLGGKIRALRQQGETTQKDLAEKLGISTSYLNLIEHNQRPVTVPLLIKLAEVLDVDIQSFSEDEEARLLSELREVFSDPLFDRTRVPLAELREVAGAAPGACRAVMDLYHNFKRMRDDHAVRGGAVEGNITDPVEGEVSYKLPSEEVSDFAQDNSNYFQLLEDAAQELLRETRLQHDKMYSGLIEHLEDVFGVTTELISLEESGGAMRRFDVRSQRLQLCEVLTYSSRNFQLAHQVALLRLSDEIEGLLETAKFRDPDSRALGRIALANYFAGAVMMPYDAFLETARSSRHDIDILEGRFGASFEQVCHRLTNMRRPGASGVPMHFVRVDIAGNISKRFSASGIQISRFGGACPRWNVHDAFMTPGMIRAQLSIMPDGARYFCIACTIRKTGGSYENAQNHLAIGLGCDISYAGQFVYADSLDVDNPDAAIPIGINCRICERLNCRQRAFPPINHSLKVNENVRGSSAYVTATDDGA